MDEHPYNRKTTEVEVPPGAILVDVPDPDTKADWTQEDENAYFAAHGYCSLRGFAALQAQAIALHESFVAAKAAIEAAGGTLVKRSERLMESPDDVAKAVENNRRIVRRISAWTRSSNAVPRPALLVRCAPRRLAVRRHRRAARRLQRTGTDDSGPSDPPPAQVVLAAACAVLAGFAAGAALAVVLP